MATASGEAAVAVPPPLQDLPTAKEKRYDRQLRLWGATGQIALEETHVLLVNGGGTGVTGVETLKNLVLPGIGAFTIVDPAVVGPSDLGVNFFLGEESLGKFRSEETVRLLMELNPDVRGYAVNEPLETFLTMPGALAPYTLVIVAAPIDPAILARLQAHAQDALVPLFYLHSLGFYSSFSVQLPSAFPIVDTHPDPTATTDLRLLTPWPALKSFAREKTSELRTMSEHEKGHIPFVCILLHFLDQWRAEHDGMIPDTYREKQEFRENYVGKESPQEENFQEAYGAVLKSLNSPTPSSAVREILAAPEAQNLSAHSPAFWVIAQAIGQFYHKHNELPLPGAVPDMKAQSADYLRLQNTYKSKARKDFAEVLATVRELESSTGRSSSLSIDEKEVENFCKGAAHVSLVRGRPLRVIRPGDRINFGDRAKALVSELTNPESLIGAYVAFLAWDEFSATHTTPATDRGGEGMRVPGSDDAAVEIDEEKLTGIAYTIMDSLVNEAGTHLDEPEYSEAREAVRRACVELTRSGGAELHNIAALTGGLVAQEVIKVITRQYVPIDNTCVFDGVASRSYVLRI